MTDSGPATPDPRPPALEGITFALAGAGKVGRSLAPWTVARGARLVAVGVHRRRGPAEELAAACGEAQGTGVDLVPMAELSTVACDLLLMAVADPALDEVVAGLAPGFEAAHGVKSAEKGPRPAVVLHVAGSRGASALAPLAAADGGGASPHLGTLHPLKAFPHALPDPAEARGVMFAIDGDPEAVALAERLALAWGAVPRRVPEEDRDLYHLGATLAAGGVVTMRAAAERVARAAGLPREVLDGYLALARGALAEAGKELDGEGTFATAITGPAARGDGATVERQLAALVEMSPELADLAARVAREALAARTEAGAEETPGHRALAQALERLLE